MPADVTFDLPYFQMSRQVVPKIDIFMLHVFLAGDMIVASRFYEFVGFFIRSPIFYVTVGCLIFFFVRAVQNSYLPEIITFMSIFVMMVVETQHFAAISRQPVNYNSFAAYYPMFSFIVYPRFFETGSVERLLKILYIYSSIYVIVYFLASLTILFHVMPGDLQDRLTQSDPERGARILMVASSTLYCAYYSYFHFTSTKKAGFFILLLLAVAALFISQSRLLIVIVILFWLASLVTPWRAGLSLFSVAMFTLLSGTILYGVIDPLWNPFVIFGDDTSARIRTEGYETIRQVLHTYPILGAGISPNDKDMVAFTSNPTLAAADLGPFGIWFVFGAPGLVLYFVSVYIQCFCTRSGGCGTVENNKTLQYTGCVTGLFGCLTPTWFNGSIIGLFFSLFFRRTTAQGAEALEPIV